VDSANSAASRCIGRRNADMVVPGIGKTQTYLRDYESDLGTQCLKFSGIFATSDKKRLSGPPIPQSIRLRCGERHGLSICIMLIPRYLDSQGTSMLKFMILGVASLAFVGTAVAADLPRPQPVPAAPAPVGKYPVGKYPVGKSPVGKYPVAAPVVTKG